MRLHASASEGVYIARVWIKCQATFFASHFLQLHNCLMSTCLLVSLWVMTPFFLQ